MNAGYCYETVMSQDGRVCYVDEVTCNKDVYVVLIGWLKAACISS